jgi:hypothetical protein
MTTGRLRRQTAAALFVFAAVVCAAASSSAQGSVTEAYFKRLGLGTKATVLIVCSADDTRTTEALPLFKRLAGIPGMDKTQGRLIALTYGGLVPVRQYLSAHDIDVHRAGSFPEDAAGVPTEPGSVAVLDAEGKIVKSWSREQVTTRGDEIVDFVALRLK